jgi:hypothetical protein
MHPRIWRGSPTRRPAPSRTVSAPTQFGVSVLYRDSNCILPVTLEIYTECTGVQGISNSNSCTGANPDEYLSKAACVDETSFEEALKSVQGETNVK